MQKVLALVLLAAVATQAKYIPELVDRIAFYPEILKKLGPQGVVESSGRIVGGEVATPHEFPWQVAITINGNSFCGGSIIGERTILTAAHCADSATSFSVLLGAHDRTVNEPSQVTVRSTVSKVHENWNTNTLANDVAIITLPSPVSYTPEIQPICLAGQNSGKPAVAELVTVSGWGKTADGPLQTVSPILNKVTVPVISVADCAGTYGNIITDNIVCIDTTGGKGSCNGDSGGPLILDVSGKNNLVGIVSFGARAGCAEGFPAGFTRVDRYNTWITDNARDSTIVSCA